MRLYRKTAASGTRLDFGTELREGLDTFPKTKALGTVLQEVQGPLETAADAVTTALKAVLPLRARRRFAEYRCDAAIRVLHGRCKELDGGREGAVTEAVFPNGLAPEVTPKGEGQLSATKKLRARLAEGGLAEVKANKDALLQVLDQGYTPFVDANKALAEANAVVATAREAERARRDDHRRTVDAIFGQIRAAYPGDRAIHNVIAPETIDSESDDADEPEPKPSDA